MGQPLSARDRAAVLRVLQERAAGRQGGRQLVALRQRALITLALDSGLRLQELCALELGQVLEDLGDERVRIRSRSWITSEQAKRGAAGSFYLPIRTRRALRVYLQALRAAAWVQWHATSPVFVAHRGQAGRAEHGRLSPRAAQRDWYEVQSAARVPRRYGFHCLRHDWLNRLRAAGGDAFDLKRAARWSRLQTAVTYVHDADAEQRAAALLERAAR